MHAEGIVHQRALLANFLVVQMHAALAADDAPVDPAPIDRERTEQRLRAHEAHRRLDLAQHVGALRVRLVLGGVNANFPQGD